MPDPRDLDGDGNVTLKEWAMSILIRARNVLLTRPSFESRLINMAANWAEQQSEVMEANLAGPSFRDYLDAALLAAQNQNPADTVTNLEAAIAMLADEPDAGA